MGNRILERCESFTRAAEYRKSGLYPYHTRLARDERCGPAEYYFNGRKLLMFGSNDYLGLTYDPAVRAAAARAATHFGTGCSGSRMLNGTLTIHELLEQELCAFLKRDAVMLYSTGYQSNFGAISALTRRDDVLFMDRRNHASLVDGCRGNLAKIQRFRYEQDGELAAMMAGCRDDQGKLLILDAVFSMEGDVVDLPSMVAVARRHDATVYLDEAHSIGVLGDHGRGVCELYGLERDVHVVMGTFSKSFAAVGGFIASTSAVVDFLRHHSRSYIFSASLPPTVVETVRAALRLIATEPERRERLMRNAKLAREALESLGLRLRPGSTPILAVYVGDEEGICRTFHALLDEGVYVNPVLPPAAQEPLLRISCQAIHTERHIERLCDALAKVKKRLKLVPQQA